METQTIKQTYSAPSLVPLGDAISVTLGDNPITPPEAVDLQGFDQDI